MAALTEEDIVTVNGIPLPLRTTRKWFAGVSLAFCFAVISLVTWLGDPTNTLHTSAQSWAFSTAIAVIAGYIFGAVYDNYAMYKSMPGMIVAQASAKAQNAST